MSKKHEIEERKRLNEIIHKNGDIGSVSDETLQTIKSLDIVKSKCLEVLPANKSKFVNAYISSNDNVAEASKLAGIASRTGYRWIEDPVVRHAINLRRSELQGAFKISPEMVIGNLARIAFEQDPVKYGMKWSEVTRALELLSNVMGFAKAKDEEKEAPIINFGVAIFEKSGGITEVGEIIEGDTNEEAE